MCSGSSWSTPLTPWRQWRGYTKTWPRRSGPWSPRRPRAPTSCATTESRGSTGWRRRILKTFCWLQFLMFRHTAWAGASYSSCPGAAGTVGTKSTGGFLNSSVSPCTSYFRLSLPETKGNMFRECERFFIFFTFFFAPLWPSVNKDLAHPLRISLSSLETARSYQKSVFSGLHAVLRPSMAPSKIH